MEEDEPSEYSGLVIGLSITIIVLIWIFLAVKFCIYPEMRKRAESTSKTEEVTNASTTEIELQKTQYGYASEASENENNTNSK